jgi:tetratricopeptide (TPR) repeat protein
MTESDLIGIEARYYKRYYRLALAAARRRDLRGAVLDARCALALNPEHEGAAKLLSLCLDELGDDDDTPDGLEKVRALVEQKKWRNAEKAAKSIPRQSVRILNIRACLLAAAKRYASSSACFAKVLTMDRCNALASEGLAETAEITARRKWWQING